MTNVENRKTFKERLKDLSLEDQMLIDFAYDIAKESHRPQQRDAGERYFEHLRAAALILMDEVKIFNPDLIISALLHDSVEDTRIFGNGLEGDEILRITAFFRISRLFNKKVASLILNLTNLGDDETYFQNLKNSDSETILLKMCDRLHNLRTINSTTAEKRERKLKETEEKYYSLFEETMSFPNYKDERSKLFEKIMNEVRILRKTHA